MTDAHDVAWILQRCSGGAGAYRGPAARLRRLDWHGIRRPWCVREVDLTGLASPQRSTNPLGSSFAVGVNARGVIEASSSARYSARPMSTPPDDRPV